MSSKVANSMQARHDHDLVWNMQEKTIAPFLLVAQPWLQDAENRIQRFLENATKSYPGVIDHESLLLSARQALHSSLLTWISQPAVIELNLMRHQNRLHGKNSTQRFHNFIAWLASETGRKEFFETYPVLHHCIELRTQQGSDFFIEILSNFLNDRVALIPELCDGEDLPPLVKIIPGKGDRHAHGRTVSVLEFSDGRKLIYKPRSVMMEAAFANLIGWMNAQCIGPKQRAALALPRDDYGYMEFISCEEISAIEDANIFYERVGGMIAVCYLLSATDMHYENIIANGEYPVLIDLETLVHPTFSIGGGRDPRKDSILCSEFLPRWIGPSSDQKLDICGLASRPETVQARVSAHPESDNFSFVKQAVQLPQWSNLPLINGQPIHPADFLDAIVEGFESTYRGLMQSRAFLTGSASPLLAFKGLDGRVILRSTDTYCSLLRAFSHPNVLQSQSECERLLEMVQPVSEQFSDASDILCAEQAALRRYDVPRFRINSDETLVRDDRGKPLCHTFKECGYEAMKRCLHRLEPADLERQSRLLRQTLVGMTNPISRKSWPHQPYATTDNGSAAQSHEMVSMACQLANQIAAAGLPTDKGNQYLQIPSGMTQQKRSTVPAPLDWSLYKGLTGVALFMAQIADVTEQPQFRKIAEDMVKQARAQILDQASNSTRLEVGAFSGLAGWSYALFYLGILWTDTALIKEAFSWLPKIAQRVDDDNQFDLIGGAAGALWVCLRLYQVTKDERALAVAKLCAEHLIQHTVATGNGMGWTGAAYPDSPLTGFGHGASGAALGLAWLGELSGCGRYEAIARAALAYEFGTFDKTTETFADLRQDRATADGRPGQVYAWCHGAPGMGIARLCLPPSFRDHQWYLVINAALKATFKQGLGGSHCLCHGDLGNIELLLQAEKMELPGINELNWQQVIPQLLERIRFGPKCGSYSGAEPIDLMTGLAGIGYGLLRIAIPERIPSVLTLDLPVDT